MKVHVKKKGNYYTVYQDAGTLKPAILTGPEDEPLGCVGLVPCSEKELRQQFPKAEFIIHDMSTKEQTINVRSRESKVAAEQAIKSFEASLKPEDAQTLKNNSAPPVTGGVKAQVDNPVTIVNPKVDESVSKLRALEFLKRLEFAAKYASDENKTILAIQSDVVKELIAEVFGG